MYKFAFTFDKAYQKNIGIPLEEDDKAYISMVCNEMVPHKKIDNKGRPSAYWTCLIKDKPITIVGDYQKFLIVTAIKEIHNRGLSRLILDNQ